MVLGALAAGGDGAVIHKHAIMALLGVQTTIAAHRCLHHLGHRHRPLLHRQTQARFRMKVESAGPAVDTAEERAQTFVALGALAAGGAGAEIHKHAVMVPLGVHTIIAARKGQLRGRPMPQSQPRCQCRLRPTLQNQPQSQLQAMSRPRLQLHAHQQASAKFSACMEVGWMRQLCRW